MSHFYGTLQGSRGEASRCGTKNSGVVAYAAGWRGAIRTRVWYDADADCDRYEVSLVPWQGSGGESQVLASGILDASEQHQKPLNVRQF